jgi:hypothetical protein
MMKHNMRIINDGGNTDTLMRLKKNSDSDMVVAGFIPDPTRPDIK